MWCRMRCEDDHERWVVKKVEGGGCDLCQGPFVAFNCRAGGTPRKTLIRLMCNACLPNLAYDFC
jgi:hypothetical protein